MNPFLVECVVIVRFDTHYLTMELPEHHSLFGLSVYVGPHLPGGAVLHCDLALIDLVFYIKIFNLDLFGPLRDTGLTVGFEKDSTDVVLVEQ